MTEIEIRIAIAEWMGWQRAPSGAWFGLDGQSRTEVPQYDLNEMHEAEKTLNACEWEAYRINLTAICDSFYHKPAYAINATAAQRREAFLRTIGKWKD